MTAVTARADVKALASGDGLTADQQKGGQEAEQRGGFQCIDAHTWSDLTCVPRRSPLRTGARNQLGERQCGVRFGGGIHQDGVAFREIAGDQFQRQRILDQPLDGALHRTGAVLRVVALRDDPVLGRRR